MRLVRTNSPRESFCFGRCLHGTHRPPPGGGGAPIAYSWVEFWAFWVPAPRSIRRAWVRCALHRCAHECGTIPRCPSQVSRGVARPTASQPSGCRTRRIDGVLLGPIRRTPSASLLVGWLCELQHCAAWASSVLSLFWAVGASRRPIPQPARQSAVQRHPAPEKADSESDSGDSRRASAATMQRELLPSTSGDRGL